MASGGSDFAVRAISGRPATSSISTNAIPGAPRRDAAANQLAGRRSQNERV
jgi:hypothetical protein